MNSSQSFCQYDYDNNQSINQFQQMELDRIHQVQQQAVLQRHMALLRQQSKNEKKGQVVITYAFY